MFQEKAETMSAAYSGPECSSWPQMIMRIRCERTAGPLESPLHTPYPYVAHLLETSTIKIHPLARVRVRSFHAQIAIDVQVPFT